MVEKVAAQQLHRALDEADYLDTFQSEFGPEFGLEIAWVVLLNDICHGWDGNSVSLLILLDHLANFHIIDHGTLLNQLSGLGEGSTMLCWFTSFLQSQFHSVVIGKGILSVWG